MDQWALTRTFNGATIRFNPWRGCTKVSPGCANCYAEAGAKRSPAILGKWGPDGTRVVASEAKWRELEQWDRDALLAGERHRVFSASYADVFEDWPGPMITSRGVPYWWCHGSLSNSPMPSTGLPQGCRMATMADIRERHFQAIRDTPNLDHLLVTKRPENVLRMALEAGGLVGGRLPDNLWLGTTVEDQQRADERIPHLLETPAAVRFLSVEPMLGPIDLTPWLTAPVEFNVLDAAAGRPSWHKRPSIDWVIVGGESGPKARPFDLAWARSVREQCRAAGVAFFMKQLGSRPVREIAEIVNEADGKVHHRRPFGDPAVEEARHAPGYFVRPGIEGIGLRDSHGGDWDEWPEDLRVREFPTPLAVA